MFGFLKKLFPQKGESLEDLDDMYAEEELKYEEEAPQIKNACKERSLVLHCVKPLKKSK